MKNLSIKVLIILVVALAAVSTAYATPPTTVDGDWYISEVTVLPDGSWVPTIAFTGPIEGEFTHNPIRGRADHVVFVGCVQGVYGEFDATALLFWNSLETSMTINHGSGDLKNLRGRGTAVISDQDAYGLPKGKYEMNIHFDPSKPDISPECGQS